ncbi:MAG: hypothetical protein F4X92_01935 [Gammaproteobacteria bacterium]|nr:hypothetical protein [Gammaproteobacteria bacterium]
MPDKPSDHGDQRSQLFEDVSGKSTPRLKNAVEKVDGITSDEEADLKRGGQLALRNTRRNIYRWALWSGFVLLAILVMAICTGIIWLGFHYFDAAIKDPQFHYEVQHCPCRSPTDVT